MSKTAYMRGLQNFISDIRAAQNKEQEQRRVDKELAKIRERFGDDKSLSGYDRRKYVWKLLYIYMLGYDIDFGHKQAADLIPQPKYKDKQVGYMACSLLLQENDEFLRLTMNGIHNDLSSRNEAFETLALSFIGNVGGVEMAEALTPDVIKLLSSGASRPVVKKRAALALLRLIRKTNPEQQVVTPDVFSPVVNSLLEERDLGLLLSATTMLQGICARNGAAGYEGAQPRLIRVLERLTVQREREVPPEYLYYGIPSPWLQCKCLRVLQFFPPPETPAERNLINTVLQGIIDGVGSGDAAKGANPNKGNALHAILFEAISLALHLDTDRKLLTTCVGALGRFLTTKDPNAKYLALETLSRLALVPDILEAIRHHQATVVESLKDPDVSIRKRSMDLLFTMCDTSCAEELVGEMLRYLQVADFSMREELVLKIAILAEKFAPSVQWYVDAMLQLLEKAGDFVSEDIWHRVVQLVTNNPSMQQYAARNMVDVLRRGAAHESLVCTAAYLLGEFGRLITNEVSPTEQFKLLHSLFPPATQPTKGLLMTAYIKIYLLDPQNAALRQEVVGLFERYQKFMDAELQQRAVEYLRLAASPQAASQHYLLPMPKWEERESSLLRRLQQHEGVDADATAANGGPGPRRTTGTPAGSVTSPTVAGSAPGGTRLVIGGPANPSPQPSINLLGDDTPTLGGATAAPLMGTGAASSAAAPQRAAPANTVDLLADLLSDSVTVTPPAPAAPAPAPSTAPGMPPAPGPTAFAPPAGQGMPPQQGMYPGQAPPPGPYGQPPAPGNPYAQQMPPPPLQQQQPGMPGMQPAPSYPGAPQMPFTAYPSASAPAPLQPQGTMGHGAVPAPQYSAAAPMQPAITAPPAVLAPSASMSSAYGGALQPAPTYPVAGPAAAATTTGGVPPPALAPAGSGSGGGAGFPVGAAATGGSQVPHLGMVSDGGGLVRPVGSLEHWYSALLGKERGILYEDNYLQIGLQSRYARASGQIVLYLGNKHTEASLQSVQLLATPPAGLALQMGPSPPVLAPKQQVQVPITITSIAPFSGPPALVLMYTLGPNAAPVRADLRLPVLPHKFVAPEQAIPKEFFFDQWKAHSAPPAKAQEMVDRGAAGPLAVATLGTALRAAGLGVEHGYLDPSPYNEAGAGYFVATPAGPGTQEQTVLVMARVEGNPQNMAQFRVTVSSPAPALSAQIKELVVAYLRAAAA